MSGPPRRGATRRGLLPAWADLEPAIPLFVIYQTPMKYLFRWAVTDGTNSGAETACKNWDDVLEQLGYWAEEVRYVDKTPDPSFWSNSSTK